MTAQEKRGGLGLVGIVLVSIAALWAVDIGLERADRSESREQANAYWSSGMRLLSENRASDAVEVLRKAHAAERTNAQYGLDLVTALTAAGKFDEAADLVNDLLSASPNDGPTNLAAARLMARRGKLDDTKAYYHRAIYGVWPQDARKRRIETQFELADLLDSQGAATELLAELLPLEPEVQSNSNLEKRVAELYLRAHSPARAASAYLTLLAAHPDDPGIYAGFGEAELELANYSAAESAFRNALRRDSGDPRIRAQLNLASAMAARDPTLRRLTSREKYDRSIGLLEAARDSLAACAVDSPMIEEADRTLKQHVRAYVTNEAAEALLELAQRVWSARVKACGTAVSASEEPVERIIAALSRP